MFGANNKVSGYKRDSSLNGRKSVTGSNAQRALESGISKREIKSQTKAIRRLGNQLAAGVTKKSVEEGLLRGREGDYDSWKSSKKGSTLRDVFNKGRGSKTAGIRRLQRVVSRLSKENDEIQRVLTASYRLRDYSTDIPDETTLTQEVVYHLTKTLEKLVDTQIMPLIDADNRLMTGIILDELTAFIVEDVGVDKIKLDFCLIKGESIYIEATELYRICSCIVDLGTIDTLLYAASFFSESLFMNRSRYIKIAQINGKLFDLFTDMQTLGVLVKVELAITEQKVDFSDVKEPIEAYIIEAEKQEDTFCKAVITDCLAINSGL